MCRDHKLHQWLNTLMYHHNHSSKVCAGFPIKPLMNKHIQYTEHSWKTYFLKIWKRKQITVGVGFNFFFLIVTWINISSVKLHPQLLEIACLMFYFGMAVNWRAELLWNYSWQSRCGAFPSFTPHRLDPSAASSTFSRSGGAVPWLQALGLEGVKLLNQSRRPTSRQAGCQWVNLGM